MEVLEHARDEVKLLSLDPRFIPTALLPLVVLCEQSVKSHQPHSKDLMHTEQPLWVSIESTADSADSWEA